MAAVKGWFKRAHASRKEQTASKRLIRDAANSSCCFDERRRSLASLLHAAGAEVAVDFLLGQEAASTGSYPVEVSGWDTSDAFFVEKTTLNWCRGDEKEISLRSPVHKDAVVFVRLLQQFSRAESFPIAYQADGVKTAGDGRTLIRLARLHPRAPFKETVGAAAASRTKVA